MAKTNNNHKYPDANHQPRHEAADRVGRSEARQEAYDALTLEQKLAQLPPEPHAKKQRARLLALLAKKNVPKQEVENYSPFGRHDEHIDANDVEMFQKQDKPKKYMKGSNQQ